MHAIRRYLSINLHNLLSCFTYLDIAQWAKALQHGIRHLCSYVLPIRNT